MKNEMELYLQDVTIEQLLHTKVGDKFQRAMSTFEKVQQYLYAFADTKGKEKETAIKIGTIMTFSLLQKFAGGKKPSELSSEDWKDIAKDVSDYAVFQEDQKYVQFVFCMYERYIRYSADSIEGTVPEHIVLSIRNLADEIQTKTGLLESEQIEEVVYIEDCLWISLEAMIKLLSVTAYRFMDKDYAEFGQAMAIYAFEYGRFILYRQEQELVNEFVRAQHNMDKELEEKYTKFISALEEQSKQFYVLIDNAFVPDFRETFLHSIKLAQAVGVKEEEVLKTVEDTDSFFED